MPYVPRPRVNAHDVNTLQDYLEMEFISISRSMLDFREVDLRPSARVPLKPKTGMIVYADGTNWNPGSGAGVYVYMGGVWALLGAVGGGVGLTHPQVMSRVSLRF